MWKFIKHHEFYLSIFILLFCTVWMSVFFGHYTWYNVLPLGISWLGLIFLFDFLERKYFAHSFMPDTAERKRKLLLIASVALIFCTLLDGMGVFIGRLWYYPLWSLGIYLILAPSAYAAYTLLLFILYEFARDLVTGFKKGTNRHLVNKKLYENIMQLECIFGIVGSFLGMSYALRFLNNPLLSPFIINQKSTVPFSIFYLGIIISFSTFFIFEFICFQQNKQTLTHDLLSGNWWPIIFIMIANILAVILIEFLNGPFQVWRFANWPYDNLRIFNIPVVAILLWPIQFPVFLSMLRAVFPSKEVVW